MIGLFGKYKKQIMKKTIQFDEQLEGHELTSCVRLIWFLFFYFSDNKVFRLWTVGPGMKEMALIITMEPGLFWFFCKKKQTSLVIAKAAQS